MAKTFDDLVAQYQEAHLIPHDDLYAYLELIYEDLVNEAELGVDRIPKSDLGKEVIRRCKTDLFWMARYFTWKTNPARIGEGVEQNLIDEAHYRVVCDLFVKKDPSKSLPDQSIHKTRLLLWPRSGMKSTIDHVDTVQWVLNFPEIRILYLTASEDLAKGFVGEIKGHFIINPEEPTWMNLFFPSWCVEDNDLGAANMFTCPVWAAKKKKRKEPTVFASSVGKNKSGWHYELIKADDAVSDKNSESSEQCETISKKLYLAEKLLVLGGVYIDYVGTRYAEEEHYGVILEKNLGDPDIQVTEGPNWTLWVNDKTGVKILVGVAIKIKPETVQKLEREGKPVNFHEAGEDGCSYLLPHIMSYNWLMQDLAKDEKSFEGQRNQNPRPASSVTFDRISLLRATIPYTEMPKQGPVSHFWDFAFSKKKGRDYTTGCSVMWGESPDEGASTAFVQQVIRERFVNQTALAKAIVDFAVKYRPFVIGVEDAAGSQFLEPTIITEAIKTKDPHIIQICSHIEWVTPDNQKDAKRVRMGALHPWLSDKRLKFLNSCMEPKPMELLYSEFEKCLSSHHHDDIPDVISMQPRYAPRATQAIVENNEEMFSQSDINWNIIFEEGTDPWGRPGYGPPTPIFRPEQEDIEEEEDPVNYWSEFN
jgi:hypothetical protein